MQTQQGGYCKFFPNVSGRDIWRNSSIFVEPKCPQCLDHKESLTHRKEDFVMHFWGICGRQNSVEWKRQTVLCFVFLHRPWCFLTSYMRLFLRSSSPQLASPSAFMEEHCLVSLLSYSCSLLQHSD